MRGVLVLVGGLLLFMVLLLLFPAPLVKVVERISGIFPSRVSRFIVEVLESFLEGLRVFRSPGLLLRAAGWSLAVWLAQSLAFWVAFLAFDIQVGFDVALFVNGIVALAVAAPAAPGFFGTFHAGVVAGLAVYAAPPAAALGLAAGFHIGGFIPVTVIGLYYAWKVGISFDEVRAGETRSEDGAAEAGEESHPLPEASD